MSASSLFLREDVWRDLADRQVKILLIGHAYAIKLSCVFAAMTVTLVWTPSLAGELSAWLTAILVLNAARLLFLRRASFVAMFDAWTCRLIICLGAGTSGCMWALLPLQIDLASGQGAMLIFTMCALISGAAIQGAAYAPVVLAFVAPQLLSIAFKVLVVGDLPMAFLASLFVYAAFIVWGAYASEARFAKSARLRAEAEATAERLAFVAAHDGLTGLINRTAFTSRLEAWLAHSCASGFEFSLYLLDLDNFKLINDSLGHAAGDEVLCAVSHRLAASVGPQAVVARLGGDEFAILIAGSGLRAERYADKLLAAACRSCQVGKDELRVGASLGLASAPLDGIDAKDLLVAADLALYAAKEAGRQCWRRFDETLRATMALRGDIERDLLSALEAGEIEVWYQPQVALHSGRLIGLEALVRWRHPRHGFVSPVEIVAAAQHLRASRQLTGFILARACAKIDMLHRQGRADVGVAVNVSPREFDLYDVPALVGEAVVATGIMPQNLEIEITEEALIDDATCVGEVRRLAALGVRLAIDDFGTGCASIAYLRTLTVDRIKIDRTFVKGFAARDGDRVLVQAIIGIGRALGIEVVAEGVESAEDAVLLAGLGCHLAQGYYYGAPMADDALAVWLDRRQADVIERIALPPATCAAV